MRLWSLSSREIMKSEFSAASRGTVGCESRALPSIRFALQSAFYLIPARCELRLLVNLSFSLRELSSLWLAVKYQNNLQSSCRESKEKHFSMLQTAIQKFLMKQSADVIKLKLKLARAWICQARLCTPGVVAGAVSSVQEWRDQRSVNGIYREISLFRV